MRLTEGTLVEVRPYGVEQMDMSDVRWKVLGFSGQGFDDDRGRIPADFVEIQNLADPTNTDWVHESWLVPA